MFPIERFRIQNGRPYSYCRSCEVDIQRASRAKHPGKKTADDREMRRRARREALEHYGNKCSCCGEWRIPFLGIDHINGGGRKHRKAIHMPITVWLKRNNYPEGYRILCHNCNLAIGFYGACPHDSERKEIMAG
jgi:hypothetical protein